MEKKRIKIAEILVTLKKRLFLDRLSGNATAEGKTMH